MKEKSKKKLKLLTYFLGLIAVFLSCTAIFSTRDSRNGKLDLDLTVLKTKVPEVETLGEFENYMNGYLNKLNEESNDNDYFIASEFKEDSQAFSFRLKTRRVDRLKGLGDIRYAKGEHFFKNNNTNEDLITNIYNGSINRRIYRVMDDGKGQIYDFKTTQAQNNYKVRMLDTAKTEQLSIDETLNHLQKSNTHVMYFEIVDLMLFDEIKFKVDGRIQYHSVAFDSNDEMVNNLVINRNEVTIRPITMKAFVDGDFIDANMYIGYFVYQQNISPLLISGLIVAGILLSTLVFYLYYKDRYKEVFSKKNFRKIWQFKTLYALIFPALLLLVLFRYLPMLYLSAGFMEYSPLEGLSSEWVGLKYFNRILYAQNTPEMYRIFRNTIFISLIRIASNIPFIIFLALVIHSLKKKRVKTVFQAVSLIPYFLSWVAIGGLFYSFLNPETGLVNRLFGLSTNWYTVSDPWWSILSLSSLWKGMGWSAIIYIAGMSQIDTELYDAAKIDGCGPVRQALTVTIPGIMNIIALQLILDVANITRDNYDQIYAMTNGSVMGPLQESVDVVGRIALTSLRDGNFGSATAIGLIQGLIGLILVVVANRIVRKSDNEGIM